MAEQLGFEDAGFRETTLGSEASTSTGHREADPNAGATGNSFRSIHYLGSKQRLLSEIQAAVDDIAPSGSRLIDLFSGSGTVSHHFSRKRPVTAVDIQEYSRVLCSALLNGSPDAGLSTHSIPELTQDSKLLKDLLWAFDPLISTETELINLSRGGESEALCNLLENACFYEYQLRLNGPSHAKIKSALNETERRLASANLLNSKHSVVSRYYGGTYFSYSQAVHIDAARATINKYYNDCDSAIAALLSTASDISNTVGNQFAQPIRPRDKAGSPKASLSKKVAGDRQKPVLDTLRKWLTKYLSIGSTTLNHKTVRGDFSEVLSGMTDEVGVIYADPPYTRDHYSRFYHVLETIALQDQPSIARFSTSPDSRFSRGIYRMERHQSPFCIRSTAPDAFRSLFKLTRDLSAPLVLSYSPYEAKDGTHPRVVSRSQLMDIASDFFENLECVELSDFNHSQLNKSDRRLKARAQSEILLICR